MLADDVAALDDQGTRFLVQPAFPSLAIWPNTPPPSRPANCRACGRPSRSVLCSSARRRGAFRFEAEALPLGAVYFLGPRRPGLAAPAIEPIAPANGLVRLAANTYSRTRVSAEHSAREFSAWAGWPGRCRCACSTGQTTWTAWAACVRPLPATWPASPRAPEVAEGSLAGRERRNAGRCAGAGAAASLAGAGRARGLARLRRAGQALLPSLPGGFEFRLGTGAAQVDLLQRVPREAGYPARLQSHIDANGLGQRSRPGSA